MWRWLWEEISAVPARVSTICDNSEHPSAGRVLTIPTLFGARLKMLYEVENKNMRDERIETLERNDFSHIYFWNLTVIFTLH